MAASTLAKPGTEYGPCEDCDHMDCEDVRRIAAFECPNCSAAIGYDRRFYLDAGGYVHASCLEDAVKAGAA